MFTILWWLWGLWKNIHRLECIENVRVGTIGGGSSEIMREIIAKMMINEVNYAKAPQTNKNGKGAGNGVITYFTEEHELFRQTFRDF